MIDPKIDIKQFATKEEKIVEAWFGSNWIPFSVGLVLGIIVMLVLNRL